MKKEDWQSDWKCFVQALASYIVVTESDDELSRPFSGQCVTWNGKLAKLDLDEVAPSVEIDLPAIRIQLRNGRTDILDGIGLPIAKGSSKKWNKFQVGDCITFQANFTSSTLFPSIQVKHLKSGKSVILIGLMDGVPIA